MRVILEVLEGSYKGRSFIFDRRDTYIVGRSRFAHCSIPDDGALSRDHFMLEINPPQCELRDLESLNKTFVNNQPVQRIRLASGDMIAAGKSVFRVKLDQAPLSSCDTVSPSASEAGSNGTSVSAIRCEGCRTPAPQNVLTAGRQQEDTAEVFEWWCPQCRSKVVALPQPVPHYKILREIGRGMGVVYQARHNQTGQMVALKLIRPETATTRTAIERFGREMWIIRQLKHPHIVEWYEQGEAGGQFWFAMEYVAGPSLEVLAKEHPGSYPTDKACRLICQILKGLDQAHGKDIVHRDLKPENILIARTPEGLMAKISDFGLAKCYRSVVRSELTFTGEMRGTVPFSPREQILDFRTVTPLADLYATAATLYFLLTCKYIHDEPADGGVGELIRMILEEQPVPVRSRRADIPEPLADIIMRCLSLDPKQRIPDANSMRAALKPFC